MKQVTSFLLPKKCWFSINLIIYFLSINYYSFGQNQLLFKRIDQSQGLSSGSVTAIIQDSIGFVWIGTKSGLNRYDGFDYKIYTHKNSNLSADDISDLLIDHKGRLWIGTTGGGVNRYDQVNDEFVVYKNDPANALSLASNHINKIYEDSQHNILIGTESGLCLFNEEKGIFTNYLSESINPSSESHNSIKAIIEDENKNLWIGSFGGGLSKLNLDDGVFEYFPTNAPENSLSADFIYTIISISKNRLLIGTSGSGLLVFDINTKIFSAYFKQNNTVYKDATIIRDIHIDSNGLLWIATDGQGILTINEDGTARPILNNYFNNTQFQSSLAGNAIYTIYEDKGKNVWIGSAWRGISILESNKSELDFFYSDFTGENPSPVLSIYKDKKQLWFGSDGKGISVYDYRTNKTSSYLSNQKLPIAGVYVQLIKPDKDGAFWIGTFANGLYRFDPQTNEFENYRHLPNNPQSLSYNDVRDVLEDDNGNIWVATWGGGLCHFNKKTKKFRSFKHNKNNLNSISSDNVLSLRKNQDGKIWIATFGGGLNLFDPVEEKFQSFQNSVDTTSSISIDNVLNTLSDHQGNFWIGTWGDGLCRFDSTDQKLERFEDPDGIGNNTILGMQPDDDGNIWISTKTGISKFNSQLNTFTNFPELSGEYHINSAFKDKDGKIYFGGIAGVVRFDPRTINIEHQKPFVQLTNIMLFNKEVKIGKGEILSTHVFNNGNIVLQHNQTVITFGFSALQFPFSNDCEYAIKMENFDNEWRNIGTQRSSTFTNLSPGAYQFKVKARNRGGAWNESYASFNIEILKPFWTTWWAYSLYVLLFAILLYFFQQYSVSWIKLKNKLKMEKILREKETELYNLKQKFFTNISHEIRTPVTLILGAMNRINESHLIEKKYKESLSSIKKNGNHLLHLVNELLDIRKLDAKGIQLNKSRINFTDYAKEIFLSFNGQALSNNIKYQFDAVEENIEMMIDADQMEKVIYNLLSNAFKFTPTEGSIIMKLWSERKKVYLSVADTGQGIKKNQLEDIFKRFYQTPETTAGEEKGYGLGLSIVRDIVHLHGGEISVKSDLGKGSCFTLVLNKTIQKKGTNEYKESDSLEAYKNKREYTEDLDTSAINDTDITILVVEDNAEIREYLLDWLQTKFKILTAENGKIGLELAQKHIPDLVISDVMMPVMDGIAFTRELKSNSATSHIPVIILTARTLLVYKKEGFETGADDYITKPFSEDLLMARIASILKNRERLRQKFMLDQTINPKELAINTPDQKFLNELLKIIEENIHEGSLNAKLLTRELGMSHSVIYKKIKALTGLSMADFIRDFKLKRAAQLIGKYGFSVTDVCYKVGFTDRRYFTRIFKQKFGKSPSEYVKDDIV